MIDFEDALQMVIESAQFIGQEMIDFRESLHRILAEDVVSDIDLPPFDKSAMDGFACRRIDIDKPLKVLETIAAGQITQTKIGEGECIKIMTGAPVPFGADTVIMVEHIQHIGHNIVRFTGNKTTANIAYKGEDVKTGDIVLKKKSIIKPQHIAVLASVGCANPVVAKKPKVAVMSTGDELVGPFDKPGKGQIRNSNSYQLINQINNCYCESVYAGIIPDDKELTNKAVGKALQENDVVILTGGVSMGEYDFVTEIIKQNGVDIMFQQLAVKPGKPTVFGVKSSSYIFGLPGNPVSCFIIFELMVKPFLMKLMGYNYTPKEIRLPMQKGYKRKKVNRMAWLPVNITGNGEVTLAEYHGSGHIHAICESDGMISVQKGISEIKIGELVNVRPF